MDLEARATQAYEEWCAAQGVAPNDEDRLRWIEDWAALEAEDRAAGAEAYWAEQRRYFAEGV